MILITGGAWQGKLAFARELAGGVLVPVADGREDSFETALERPVIGGFHNFVKRLLAEGKSVEEFITLIEDKNSGVIITSDELGCGIVPADPADREWRENSGRAQVRLAADAETVYRMICGIATQLKEKADDR